MKKILIVPILLALIIFSLYHEDVDGMPTTKKGHTEVTHEIEIAEKVIEVFNNSKNEITVYTEQNETNESEDKTFSVKILGDLNVTKESIVRLVAEVKNADDLDKCNYFWYEGKQLISMGAVLEETFLKGEHRITVVVKDANGLETNDTVVIGAYDYYSTKRLNYDPHYGNLLYVERHIMNHKGQYVLYDDGTYSKEYSSYDESNNLIEQIVEYYTNPNENRKILYTYDDRGNRLTTQTFDSNGESVFYVLNTYDENGTIISRKQGKSEDDLGDENDYYSQVIHYADPYATTSTEVSIPEDIVRMNENGQVIYEERHYYGGHKSVNEMSYNENGDLTKSVRQSTSSYDSRLDIIDYNKDGNAVKREVKYEVIGTTPCHYLNERTYTSSGQTESMWSTLLDGECRYIDEVKRTYSYDEDGRIASIKASTDEESASGINTLVVVNEYTNELDI